MEFPLNFGLYKTGLPLILTSGKLKDVCFLIDTGSTCNFIFSYVYEHFKDKYHTLKETQKTMGIEDNFQVCKTVEVTFNLKFNALFYNISAIRWYAQNILQNNAYALLTFLLILV